MPGMSASRSARAARGGSASRRSDRAYRDAAASRTARRPRASSTLRPAYITTTRSAVSATTPRSWVMKIMAMPASACSSLQQAEHLRLHRDIERRGRLVGDQHRGLAGDRHGDHHALAHAARQLMRIIVEPARRVGHADLLQQLQRACACRAPRQRRCGCRNTSTIWSPTVATGLSELIGSWKIMPISLPRTSLHLALRTGPRDRGRSSEPRRRRCGRAARAAGA